MLFFSLFFLFFSRILIVVAGKNTWYKIKFAGSLFGSINSFFYVSAPLGSCWYEVNFFDSVKHKKMLTENNVWTYNICMVELQKRWKWMDTHYVDKLQLLKASVKFELLEPSNNKNTWKLIAIGYIYNSSNPMLYYAYSHVKSMNFQIDNSSIEFFMAN